MQRKTYFVVTICAASQALVPLRYPEDEDERRVFMRTRIKKKLTIGFYVYPKFMKIHLLILYLFKNISVVLNI